MSDNQMVGGAVQATGILTSGANFDDLVKQVHATFHERLAKYGPHLFLTESKNLSTTYRRAFPEAEQQHHNCTQCRHFFNRFGSMVFISAEGESIPALWDASTVPEEYRASIAALEKRVGKQEVQTIFYTPFAEWGTPATPVYKEGTQELIANWTHHTAPVLEHHVVVEESIGTLQGNFNTDYDAMDKAFSLYSVSLVATAINLLTPLTGLEKYIRQLEWLHGVLKRADAVRRNPNAVRNLLMREVSLLEDRQWANIANRVVGDTFLAYLKKGNPQTALKNFLEKIDPEVYRQQTAAPTEGNVKVTQEIFAKLGLEEGDLMRRMASVDELRGVIWTPPVEAVAEPVKSDKPFANLATKQSQAKPAEVAGPVVDAGAITWARFQAEVLPKAKSVHVKLPNAAKFIFFTAAAKSDAGRIFFYDKEEQRNTYAAHTTANAMPMVRFGKTPGELIPVRKITEIPSAWDGDERGMDYSMPVLVLDGLREFREDSHLAIFPQLLRPELFQAERVISAFSNSNYLDISTEDQALGCGINGVDPWRVRVTTEFGQSDYVIDRKS